jgi:hypothetical protein
MKWQDKTNAEFIEVPVQRVEVTHSSISFWRKIFSILSIKIQLNRKLIAVIYLHYVYQFNQYKNAKQRKKIYRMYASDILFLQP